MGVKKSNLLLWVATTLEILSRGRGTKKVKNRWCSLSPATGSYPKYFKTSEGKLDMDIAENMIHCQIRCRPMAIYIFY